MKIFNIIIFCLIISIFTGYGCMGGKNTEPTPSVSSTTLPESTSLPEASKAPELQPTKQASFPNLEIPQAKELAPDVKSKVDKFIKLYTEKKDLTASDEIKKICKEKKNDLSIYAYLLENPDPDIANIGLDGLKNIKDPAKSEQIFDIMAFGVKHPSDYIRSWAFDALTFAESTEKQKEKIKEISREALNDPSGHVRVEAVRELSSIEDKESVDKIKEMMKSDPAPQVVAQALEGLDRMNIDITEDLLNYLDKGTPYVKCNAIYILSGEKYKDKHKELIPKLIGMLDDKTETWFSSDYDTGFPMSYNTYSPTIRESAIMGLEKMTGKEFKGKNDEDIAGKVEKWKEWYKKEQK